MRWFQAMRRTCPDIEMQSPVLGIESTCDTHGEIAIKWM